MAEGSGGDSGVFALLFFLACVGMCGYGAVELWENHGPTGGLQENVFVTCKQGTEEVFSGVAKGEPARLRGSIRIQQLDGNVTVLDGAAHCVTSTLRKPKEEPARQVTTEDLQRQRAAMPASNQ